jgi:NSS family neurotransmitter:Na+ symporter
MKQSQWSSRLGYILAAAGSAVGLGAIWKFPYVTAANGGGAFLLVFLLFSFTLGVAVLMGETLIGSLTRRGVKLNSRKTSRKAPPPMAAVT